MSGIQSEISGSDSGDTYRRSFLKTVVRMARVAPAFFIAGCASADPSYMEIGPVANFTNSDKAIVIVDGVQGSGLIFDRHLYMVFSTLDARSTVVEDKMVIQNKFQTLRVIVPMTINPGRYAFLAYRIDDAGRGEIADIGGWTNQKEPLLAGFTVKAGEVVYLGHLVFTYGKQGDQETMKVKVEDRSVEDGKEIRSQLDHYYPGTAANLQTRLMTIYREDVPTKSN